MEERDRSSDSGLPPSPPSRLAPVASWRGSNSPHSGGTVPDSHRVPSPCSLVGGAPYHRGVPASVALRLWAPVVLWAAVIFAFSSVLGNYSYAEVNLTFLGIRAKALTALRTLLLAAIGIVPPDQPSWLWIVPAEKPGSNPVA